MKKICPVCNKKIDNNEELCPKCGYYFSLNNFNIDSDGRVYNDYQESMHSEHYQDTNNKDSGTKTVNVPHEYILPPEYLETDADNEIATIVKNIGTAYSASIVSVVAFFIFMAIFMNSFIFSVIGELNGGLKNFSIMFGILIFLFIMLFILILFTKSLKVLTKSKKLKILAEKQDYNELVNFVQSMEKPNKNYQAFYLASIVSLYKLNDYGKARSFLLDGMDISVAPIFDSIKFYRGMLKELEIEQELLKRDEGEIYKEILSDIES